MTELKHPVKHLDNKDFDCSQKTITKKKQNSKILQKSVMRHIKNVKPPGSQRGSSAVQTNYLLALTFYQYLFTPRDVEVTELLN